jgi:cell division protein ZapA
MESASVTYAMTLLGKKYEIKCPEQELDHLKASADKLNAVLQETKAKYPALTEFQLMMMSALSISHELITCQRREAEDKAQIGEIVRLLEQTKPLLLTGKTNPVMGGSTVDG